MIADCRKILQIAATLAAAILAVSATRIPAQAETNHMLVVPASDGYGFDDCLGAGKACGRVIADAWCEAHGMSASVSFGRADDMTASVPKSTNEKPTGEKAAAAVAAPIKLQPGSFIVNCRD